jgi:hypothetical protein
MDWTPQRKARGSASPCRSTLLLIRRYPLLAGQMELVREGLPSRAPYPVCASVGLPETGGCDYRELLDDI